MKRVWKMGSVLFDVGIIGNLIFGSYKDQLFSMAFLASNVTSVSGAVCAKKNPM